HQLFVALVERAVQHRVGIGVQAREQLLVGPRHPCRRVPQTGPVRVLTTGQQQLTHRLLGASHVERRLLARLDDVLVLVDVHPQPRELTVDDDRPRRPVDAAPAGCPCRAAASAAGCTCRGCGSSARSPAATRAERRSSAAHHRSTCCHQPEQAGEPRPQEEPATQRVVTAPPEEQPANVPGTNGGGNSDNPYAYRPAGGSRSNGGAPPNYGAPPGWRPATWPKNRNPGTYTPPPTPPHGTGNQP